MAQLLFNRNIFLIIRLQWTVKIKDDLKHLPTGFMQIYWEYRTRSKHENKEFENYNIHYNIRK